MIPPVKNSRATWLKAAIVTSAILVLLGVGGWKLKARYLTWRAERSLERAREYFQQGRLEEATINLTMSMQTAKDNPGAWRLLAEIFEAAGSKEALRCRRKVAELRPADAVAGIELARCALEFNELATARNALEQMPAAGRTRPDFVETQAMLALANGNLTAAVDLFGRLNREFPGTPFAKTALLNLSKIWLRHDLPGAAKEAADRLEELADDPQFGTEAGRLLVRRSLKKQDAAAALSYSSRVAEAPGARLDDYTLLLDLMRRVQCPLYPAALKWVKNAARRNPMDAANLGEWIMDRESPKAAVEWLQQLPQAFQAAKPVPIVLADAYERLKDWPSLRTLLLPEDWGSLNSQRNAFLSTAYQGERQFDEARTRWELAVSSAHAEPGVFESLARLALTQHRTTDAVDALWRVPRGDPSYQAVQKQLYLYYRARNDSSNVLRLFRRTLDEHPDDPSAKAGVATLLLVRDSQLDLAARLAREVYEADPKSIRNAAIYAYSMYRSNPSAATAAKAVAILDSRSAEEQATDECLLYRGLLLAYCQRNGEARLCFEKLNRKILFPEMLEKVSKAESLLK